MLKPAADASEGAFHSTRQFSRWVAFSLALSVTPALVSLLIPHFWEAPGRPLRQAVDFPMQRLRWSGTSLSVDYFFPYSLAAHPQFHVEFRNGGGELVDLFIARETPEPSGLNRLPDTKLLLPSNDWSIVSRESARIWRLGIDAQRATLSRESGSKFTYVVAWRIHDDGLIRESLKSLVGFGEPCSRIVVRIAVPIFHDDDRGRERAIQTADHFVRDFKDAFEMLADG